MPIYSFKNKKTGKEFDDMMTIAEMESYLDNNKHIIQVPKGLNIVSGVGGIKHDNGWKENLSRIAEAHPQSTFADTYGKKSVKQVKTRQAFAKNKQRVAHRTRGKK